MYTHYSIAFLKMQVHFQNIPADFPLFLAKKSVFSEKEHLFGSIFPEQNFAGFFTSFRLNFPTAPSDAVRRRLRGYGGLPAIRLCKALPCGASFIIRHFGAHCNHIFGVLFLSFGIILSVLHISSPRRIYCSDTIGGGQIERNRRRTSG